MKNFTKQITNKTLFKPTRWLLVALMLLVGTSSAWGATTYLKAGEEITIELNSAAVSNQAGWNGTNLVIWDGDGKSKTIENCSSHTITEGGWIPTRFRFESRYDWSGWKGKTSDIGDCGGKEKLQPNTRYSVTLLNETNWVGTQYQNYPNKEFKINLSCLSVSNCTPTVNNQIIIKCKSDETSVYAWVWDANQNKYNGSTWPGNKITTIEDGYRVLKITTTKDLNVIFSDGQNNQTADITGLKVGKEYTYTYNNTAYELTNQDCIAPSCVTPTFTISGSDQICEGTNSYEYTIANAAVTSGVTYAWSNNLSGASSASGTGTTYTFNTSANGAKTGTITVKATNGTCTHTETKSIRQIAKPTAGTLSITSANLKIGDTKTITVTGANGGEKSWYSSDSKVATVDANGKVTAIAAGTATITYTVQPSLSGCGTAATASASITVCANIANITATPQHIIKCGDTFTQKGQITIDKVDGLTYTCKRGNTPIAVPDNGIITELETAGDYTITATNICDGTATTTVTITETQNKKTLSEIVGNPLLCNAKGADIHKFSVTNIDGATFTWTIENKSGMAGASVSSTNTNEISIITGNNQPGTATLKVVATVDGCASESKTLALTQLPASNAQAATISGNASMCAGDTQTLTVAGAIGSVNPQWASSNTAVATVDANGEVTAIATGTTNITYSIESACGTRVNSNAFAITVTGTPDQLYIQRTSNSPVCAGEAITIIAKANGATTYQLHREGKLDDKDVLQTIESTAGQVTFTQTEATAGTYRYVVVIKNACKRTNTAAVQVEVLSTPSAPSFTTDGEITCSGVTVSPILSPALAQGNYLVWYEAATGDNKIGTDGKTLISGADETEKTYYAAVSNGSCESATRTPYTVTVESSAISNLILTLVDQKGNPLADNHVYCQGDDVHFKLTYNGGMYWGEPEWNSTLTQTGNLNGILRYNPDENKGEGSYTIPNVQGPGTIAVALTMCGNTKATSNALTITVAPVPTISISADKPSAKCYENVTFTATTTNTLDGAIVIWYKAGTEVGRGDSYTFTSETASTVDDITASVQNTQDCDAVNATAPAVTFTAESCTAPALKQGGIVYLEYNGWKADGAWICAYFWNSSTNKNYWYNMYDAETDGLVMCEVPDDANSVIFVRKEPGAALEGWNGVWNQTVDLTLNTTKTKFTIGTPISNSNKYNCSNSKLDNNKTFYTIELNAGSLWNVDGATFYVHPWSDSNKNEGAWSRMTNGNNDNIFHVDISSEYDKIIFARKNSDGSTIWEQTETLYITGGTRYVITKNGGYDVGVNAEGYWSWPGKSSSYTLGVNTLSAEQDGDNYAINCSAQMYLTNCAPGIWYGFQYKQGNGSYQNVKVGEGYLKAGGTYEIKLTNLEAGTYTVRARVQYANNEAVYGQEFVVIIGDKCTEGYEFTLANTATEIIACGGSKVLPAMDIVGDKNNQGQSYTYLWTNEDGSAATNLSANNVPTPTFTGTASQNYKVTASKVVNKEVMCVKMATYQVNYTDNSPKATIEAPAEVEMNQSVTLQGAISNSESFTWTVSENGKDVTASMLSDNTILNPVFNTQEAGNYTITLTANRTEFCAENVATTTLVVKPIEEVCGGTDIEVKLTGSHNCFNTSGGSILYKKVGSDWVKVEQIGSGKTYTFASSEISLPMDIFFGALSGDYCGTSTERKGYTEIQTLTTDDLGKLITYNITGDNSENNTGVKPTDNISYTREFTVTKTSTSNTTISAPTVTNPSAQLEGTENYATLSAYFGGTGCAAIDSYGFEYIKSESEPTSWTNVSRVEVGNSTPTLGKSFSAEITDLNEGTYWFRAYATNSKTTGYSASASFLIITNGAYPQLNCNEGAVKIVDNKVQVTVKNIGNEELLKGSYQLLITNQAVPMPFTPSPVPAIAVGGSQVFTTTIDVMDPNNLNTVVKLTYQGRSQQCSITRCEPKVGGGDTIFYTIDAAAITDKCMLVFPTIYDAVNHLKSSTGDKGFVTKVGDGYILRQPVVMQVVYSSNRYVGNVRIGTVGGMTDGRKDPLVLNITNINNDGNSASKGYDDKGNYYPLIIRAANPNAIPSVQHIALRKSRQVTLQNLNIVSSDTDIDNAIDIDNNNNAWVENAIGAFRANIRVNNCNIKSKGFTCIHVSAVEDVFFQNNEINADLTNDDIKDGNTRVWGASAKFIRSTRILFLANNFTGSHATSVWLQGCETVLFMNNVFWNNNLISTGYPAMIRLIQQTSPEKPKKSGFYYNTFYLAESNSPAKNFDFLALNTQENNDAINHNGSFETTTIEFMYNNCYSYSATTAGKSSKPLKDKSPWSGICSNNFWSVYDMNKGYTTSKFEIKGCNVATPSINVQNNVCTTTASDPNSLVISGTGLNIGIQPESDLAKSLGANLITSDRTREGVRPTTPTIIDPDDVPSGVVDGDGFAPAIALVVSDDDGEGTMTHAIDVAAFTGTVAYNEYSATLAEGSNFTITQNAGVVSIGFSKNDKTQNVTYNDQVIIARNDAAAGNLIIPITGKYVSSYTGGWTLGAYQQTESIATDSIIWQGGTDGDWDNRNNWIDAKTKNTLTCVNTLAKDLKVIIPAPESQSYPTPEGGITTYPELPESFGNRDTKKYGTEVVNAGQGLGTAKQFADHIYLEYGASLRGVEALVDNEGSRYNEATTHLEVDRSTWILVGNMLKPFTNVNKTETRLLKSGDYYLARQEPNVYMHQVLIENNTPTWQKTFADLEVTVQPQEAFAIQIPDQYGQWKLSAEIYYSYVSPNVAKIRDAKEPKSYTFNGRFINEAEPLTFTGLSSNYTMANNTYPCNLDANAIEAAGYTVYLYNYDTYSWVTPAPKGSTIKPQHGFAIKQTTGASSLTVTRNMLAGGDTRYNRSATAMPYNVIRLLNANSTIGYASEIQVWYDAEKGSAALDARDAERLWSNDVNVPDLYMMQYDATLQRLYVEKAEKVIPLGVRLQQDMDVSFKLHDTNGYAEAILQDRETGKEYDLLNGKAATITGLSKGVIEGRFFLNLVADSENEFDTETAIDNIISIEPSIGIYTDGGNTIRVLGNNVELQTIYVSDMSGRTTQYNVSGSYANISLPVSKGVYLVQVIGDNVTRTEKVVIK